MQVCIHHTDQSFLIHQDYLDICEQNRVQAVVCSVFESLTNERLTHYEQTHRCPCDEDLWLEVELPVLVEQAQHLYCRSAIQGAITALETRGFLSTRYIKRDQAGNHVGQSYETYHAAQQDDLVKGSIAKQYLFHCGRIQEAITGRLSQPRDRKNSQTPLVAGGQTRGKLEDPPCTFKHTPTAAKKQQGGH